MQCFPACLDRNSGYKGQHWPTTVVYGVQEMHIFAIGDWGGMDGSLDTNEGRPNIVAYDWGKRPGPSVFPRSRWNKAHTVQFCDHDQLVECFNTRGQPPLHSGVWLCARWGVEKIWAMNCTEQKWIGVLQQAESRAFFHVQITFHWFRSWIVSVKPKMVEIPKSSQDWYQKGNNMV